MAAATRGVSRRSLTRRTQGSVEGLASWQLRTEPPASRRRQQSFDRGETFSGVDFDEGVRAAREFSALAASPDLSPARAALASVAQLEGVTTVIPGARSPEQARQNATAGSVPPLGEDVTAPVTELYNLRMQDWIHDLW